MKKKILALLLTVVMMFAMASVAWAADAGQVLVGDGLPPKGNASYVVEAPKPTTSVNVTFIMEAPNELYSFEGAFYYEVPVTLTAAEAQVFTVSDLLVQVAENDTNFQFTTKSGNSAYPFTKDSVYLYGVTHNGITWQPEDFDLWGWEYRVNNLFPVIYSADLGGYIGPDLNKTYLSNGDVIHFFVNYPATVYNFDYASNFIRLLPNVSGSNVTVQLQGQKDQLVGDQSDPYTLEMQVNPFTNFATPTIVKVYNEAGKVVASDTSDTNGKVTFSGLGAGNYVIKSDSVLLDTGDPDEEWNDCLFTQTTGYVTIVVEG